MNQFNRASILAILILLFLVVLFRYTKENVKISYLYTPENLIQTGISKEQFNLAINALEDQINDSYLKYFKSFIHFNIALTNELHVYEKELGKEVPSKFAIDINGKYTEVKTGETKIIVTDYLRFYELKEFDPNKFEFRVLPLDESLKDSVLTTFNSPDRGVFFSIVIPTSLRNYLFFLIVSIPIVWSVIQLVASIYKFIVFGGLFSR